VPIATADHAAIARAADLLAEGLLVAFPTETVYGLGADAGNGHAVAAVFEAKGRPRFNPLIVHVGDVAAAERLAVFDARARRLADAFWPGALTLVLPKRAGAPVSDLVTAGLDTIALRVPSHPVARALLRAFGGAIAAPSANPSGALSPTEAEHVERGLGDKVALILDGGPTTLGLESTIVGLIDGTPTLLRAGAIARSDIERVLATPLADPSPSVGAAPSAPGRLESHYAPRARLRLDAHTAESGEMLLAFGPDVPKGVPGLNLSPTGDLREAAANLFAYLHILDETGVATIAVTAIPEHGLGEAINDRLRRAAAPR
jgi:L-threonylcarbamoyladenylate synthase